MTVLKAYYWNYNDDEGIASDSPSDMNLDEALECMQDLPETDGNFMGLELPGKKIVQFMYDDDRGLILDMPAMEKKGTYEKVVDISEALKIIRDMYLGKRPEDISGIVFVSW